MSLRSWLVATVKADAELKTLLGITDGSPTRFYQGGGLRTAELVKPYLVYHMGNDTSELLSELSLAGRQFLTIYIHDEYGDYQLIDDIGNRLKALLQGAGSAVDNVILTRYLERSQDLSDETQNTIFRYLRFQLILGG